MSKLFSVALVGPDGSGKTTISRRLRETLPLPLKYVYMGVNPDSSNLMLPTTRLLNRAKRGLGAEPDTRGPRAIEEAVKPRPKHPVKRALVELKSGLLLANRIAEEWFRQGLTELYTRRGYVVLFDRHFFSDYYAYDIAPTPYRKPWTRRLHGWMLQRVYPKPDLMIYLDAPAEVLLARKGEGSIGVLEDRRRAYLEMRAHVPHFAQVDATQPEDAVLREVTDLILAFQRDRVASQPTARPVSVVPRPRSTALVTDAGRGSAIAIIRSLGRRGWRVIAADSTPHSLGFRSRYAAGRLVYPAPEHAPRETIAALKAVVQNYGVDLIIPVTDAVLLPLSEARAEFEGLCAIAMPTPEQLAIVTNKLKTIELAQELGVPVPLTRVVESVDEALALPITAWPVVLKPQASRLYRDQASVEHFEVCYAHTRDELARQIARFEGRCPVLLQSYYPGEGHGVELLLYEGHPLAAFQHKRLHEVPITGGASSFRQSVALDPKLYEYSVRLLGALNWTGLAMVEFKVGAEGGKLMEINGRIWGSLPLAVFSGMDFPARLASLYRDGPPPRLNSADTRYRTGVKARNVERDIVWVASVLLGHRRSGSLPVPPRSEALVGLAGMLNPLTRSDLLALDDPMPGLAELPAIVSKLAGKAARRG